jgi:hypothetical protein
MLDTSFFDVKIRVMNKVSILLGNLRDSLADNDSVARSIVPEVFIQHGKISRGENYLGYPYLVLDYPRNFAKENIFAFRSMFWWGNHFSYTLHVGGKYYESTKENFVRNYRQLAQPGIYVCVNSKPWEYHFERGNFVPAGEIDGLQLIDQKTEDQHFLKLSLRTGLQQWKTISHDGLHAFDLFTKVLYS